MRRWQLIAEQGRWCYHSDVKVRYRVRGTGSMAAQATFENSVCATCATYTYVATATRPAA